MTPDTSIWGILLPMGVFGIGNAFVWAPNSATATRNLPMQLAGAGSGVYNATRQVGAVLGSAGDRRADGPPARGRGPAVDPGPEGSGGGELPPQVAQAFSDAMATGGAAAGRRVRARLRRRAVLREPAARRVRATPRPAVRPDGARRT